MLAKNLKRLRKARRLTCQRISDMLNVPRTTYSSWERGIEPNVCTLVKLAKFHTTTIDELVK